MCDSYDSLTKEFGIKNTETTAPASADYCDSDDCLSCTSPFHDLSPYIESECDFVLFYYAKGGMGERSLPHFDQQQDMGWSSDEELVPHMQRSHGSNKRNSSTSHRDLKISKSIDIELDEKDESDSKNSGIFINNHKDEDTSHKHENTSHKCENISHKHDTSHKHENASHNDDTPHKHENTSHKPDNTPHKPDNTSHKPDNTLHKPDNTSHKHNTSHKLENTSHKPDNTSHKPDNTSHKHNASHKRENTSHKHENTSHKRENTSYKHGNTSNKHENSSHKAENSSHKGEDTSQKDDTSHKGEDSLHKCEDTSYKYGTSYKDEDTSHKCEDTSHKGEDYTQNVRKILRSLVLLYTEKQMTKQHISSLRAQLSHSVVFTENAKENDILESIKNEERKKRELKDYEVSGKEKGVKNKDSSKMSKRKNRGTKSRDKRKRPKRKTLITHKSTYCNPMVEDPHKKNLLKRKPCDTIGFSNKESVLHLQKDTSKVHHIPGEITAKQKSKRKHLPCKRVCRNDMCEEPQNRNSLKREIAADSVGVCPKKKVVNIQKQMSKRKRTQRKTQITHKGTYCNPMTEDPHKKNVLKRKSSSDSIGFTNKESVLHLQKDTTEVDHIPSEITTKQKQKSKRKHLPCKRVCRKDMYEEPQNKNSMKRKIAADSVGVCTKKKVVHTQKQMSKMAEIDNPHNIPALAHGDNVDEVLIKSVHAVRNSQMETFGGKIKRETSVMDVAIGTTKTVAMDTTMTTTIATTKGTTMAATMDNVRRGTNDNTKTATIYNNIKASAKYFIPRIINQCPVPACYRKKFSSSSLLSQHFIDKHTLLIKYYICPYCKFKDQNIKHVFVHCRENHLVGNVFTLDQRLMSSTMMFFNMDFIDPRPYYI